MTRVVGVHGAGKQLVGNGMLRGDWFPALSDGLRHAGQPVLPDGELLPASYGDLFRPPGRPLTAGDPMYTASDITDGFELDAPGPPYRPADHRPITGHETPVIAVDCTLVDGRSVAVTTSSHDRAWHRARLGRGHPLA